MAGREKPFERQKPTGAAGLTRLIPARDCRILRGSKARKPTVAAKHEAIRAARRKRQAGNGPSTSQDARGCGPRSARNRGEEPCERETLRRVNPRSGCLVKTRLRTRCTTVRDVERRRRRDREAFRSKTSMSKNAVGARKLKKAAAIRKSRRNRFGSYSEGEPKLTRDGPGGNSRTTVGAENPRAGCHHNEWHNRKGGSSKLYDDTTGRTLKGR